MNSFDRQYLDLLQDILDNGTEKNTRSGKVLSVFDRTMRFDMKLGIPLLTTKKVFYRGCIVELLWFLSGNTNIKYLIDRNVNIWTDDAYRYYRELVAKHNAVVAESPIQDFYEQNPITPVESKEEFVQRIKDEKKEMFILNRHNYIMSYVPNSYAMEYTYGDLGPVYGHQWRANEVNLCNRFSTARVDQIQKIINTLKTNPDDRRMLCVTYNPTDVDSCYGMALPPCHVMFQFWTRELKESERLNLLPKEELEKASDNWTARMDEMGIPKRKLSCSFNCRSQDLPLGTPFNLASYSFLTHIIAKLVNMVPGELIYHGGDCHIYKNQFEGVKEQLSRNGSDIIPKLKFTEDKEFKELSDFELEDFIIYDYNPDPVIKFPLSVG